MFLSVRLMPLAETYAIAFTAPLIVAILAGLTLGERVGLRRWLAIGLGFVGVLVVIRPGAGVLGAAALVPLGMAVAYAGYQLVTRRLAPLDHAFVTMFWSAAIGVAGASLLLPLGWRPPDAAGWGLMVAMGLLGLAGQLAMIRAFAMAAAPVLAPYGYTQILWAVTLGYLAFGDLPDRWTLIGSAVVVAGGAWLFVQERRTAGA
jgi:drug/metabolite transporter (DMT)-like permease